MQRLVSYMANPWCISWSFPFWHLSGKIQIIYCTNAGREQSDVQLFTFYPSKPHFLTVLSLHTCCAQCCARGPCTWAQGAWWMQSGSLQREAPGSANTTHWLMKISGQMTASLKQPWEQLLLRIKWVIPPFSLIVSLRVCCAGQGCKYSFLFFFLNRKN